MNVYPNDQKDKRQLLHDMCGFFPNQIAKEINKATNPKTINRYKYLLYLYSEQVSRERILQLMTNGNFIVHNWADISKLISETNPEDFDEEPLLKTYYEKWLNSFLGEELMYRLGNGDITHAIKKYGKRVFIKFKIEKIKTEMDEPQSYFTMKKYTDEELSKMASLAGFGYKGFYTFAEPLPNGKMRVNVIYNPKSLKPEELLPNELIPELIQQIGFKIMNGEIAQIHAKTDNKYANA